MDQATKTVLQAELMAAKGMLSSVTGLTGTLQQTTFPVSGPMVIISSLPMAAQAIKTQNDAIARLASVIEGLINAQ